MIKTFFLAVLDRQNKTLAPIFLLVVLFVHSDSLCEPGERCWQSALTSLPGFLYQRCFPGLWWPLLGHFALSQAAVCSTIWCSAGMRTGTRVPHCHIPAAQTLQQQLSLQWNGGDKDASLGKSHQLLLSDSNRFEKVAYFSPDYQSFRQIYKTSRKTL